MPDLAAKLLRFYWFRLSDAVVPLWLAISLAGVGQGGYRDWSRAQADPDPTGSKSRGHLGRLWLAGWGLVLAIGLMGGTVWQRVRAGVPVSLSHRALGLDVDADIAEQRRVMRDWIAVCRFVRASTPDDEVFLTPRHQQTFKWYAHRAEVVNWKDVPQDVASLRRWSRRFAEVYPFRLSTMRVTIRYDELMRFRDQYGVRWMIVDRRVTGPRLPLVQVYPAKPDENRTYAVYRLPDRQP